MIAAIYARKSTDQGAVSDEARSVTRQVEHARAFAASKGWTFDDAHVYVDDGISGAEFAARPGFVRLLNALKPRAPFDALIMSEESRLGREAIETAYAMKQLIQAGVRVWFYLEGRERTLDSPTDKLLMSVTAFADELEREKARQRTYDAMVRKARAGHVTGGRVFGYDNVEIALPDGTRSHVERRINEAEAAVVRRIFERYAAGDGFTTIAKWLNLHEHASPRAQQGRPHGWIASSIREVLHRELYRGRIVWGRTKKRNVWGQVRQAARTDGWTIVEQPRLAVVAPELWQAVQERLESVRARALRTGRGHLLGRPPQSSAKYLLSGLLRCGTCGATLEARTRAQRGSRVLFYGCTAYHKKGRTICPNGLTLPATAFERTVLTLLERTVLDPAVVEATLDRAVHLLSQERGADDARQVATADTVARLDREITQLAEAIATGGHLAPLLQALQRRQAEREALERSVREGRRDAHPGTLTPSDLRQLLLERLADWQRLLRGQVSQGQQIIRRLLVGPLVCTPTEDRRYRLSGRGRVDRLLEGWVPLMVASPTGFDEKWTVPLEALTPERAA